MGYIFDDWTKLLETFQQCVDKGIAEIHQEKVAVQQLKTDVFNRLDSGLYYHDPNRIVLSAPEIVIGNVDKSGDLQGGIGRVVIKGSEVALDGVGETGHIIARAPSIRQQAVDPGIDGVESVVCDTSEIISQASNIVLHSSETQGAFSQTAGAGGKGGIYIHADNNLQLEAAVTAESRKKAIESQVSALEHQAGDLKKQRDAQKATIDGIFKQMNTLLDKEKKLNTKENFSLRINLADVEDLHEQINALMPSLYQATIAFMRSVSLLAEANRKKKALEAEKDTIKTGDEFKKNTTGAAMTIQSERINIATTDGEGNLHTNIEAGIGIRTPRMGINTIGDDGKLTADGGFNVNAQNISLMTCEPSKDGKEIPVTGKVTVQAKDINLEAIDYKNGEKNLEEKELNKQGRIALTAKKVEVSTANPQEVKRDEKGELTGGTYAGMGDVVVKSKTFTVESFDYEVKEGKLQPKALTAGSGVSIRTEKTDILAADIEGKATGSVNINAKAVGVKSMDVDKEKMTDTALAAGSTMTIIAEKMYVGAKSKEIKSKKLQAVADDMALFAENNFEAQQGEAKAVVQLSGGNAAVSGSKTGLYGETTINANTEVKGELKAPKGSIEHFEAKGSFASPNISDGMAGGGGGGGGSLSPKLTKEDAPK